MDDRTSSLSWPDPIYAQFRRVGYVPDAGHSRLIELCVADPDIHDVVLTTEEEGVALAAGAARACKFREVRAISDISEAGVIRELLHAGRGPILVQARIASGDTPRVLPNRDGHAIKQRFVAALSGDGP